MFLPIEYLWLESVLIAAIVVFFVDWIGNSITFSNRLVNAFVTALLFALIFGVITYFGYGGIEISIDTVPAADAPVNQPATPATPAN